MTMRENGFIDMKYRELERNSKKAMTLALQSFNMKAYNLSMEHLECVFLFYCIAAVSTFVFCDQTVESFALELE
ncbi:unnamed protein product [Acanthoscelides obtectus]|uniref:Uncharacterized protein n=1 Tax=Acanthoscelides obtectus TaxID=200917 RepID=A0A9P0LC93_ACAOB|nr:unnamed protein product [Acanthoscelides obtectus]CAK1673999.1 hypothetical protein AOBTE_LOCUS29499 [Acanthoscelides obtectus]